MQINYNLNGNPVRNLWAAVIMNALDDLNYKQLQPAITSHQRTQRTKCNLKKSSSYNFFRSKNSSFPWICQQLSLDGRAIRKKAGVL
jgi:hypothetical protein